MGRTLGNNADMKKLDFAAISFARYFVTVSSILLLVIIMVTFALGPSLGFPLSHDQSFQIVRQITPVFIGYLGQCAFFVARGPRTAGFQIKERNPLYLIVVAPFVIFSVVFCSVIVAFQISNSGSAPPDTGMSFSRLTDWITILLGLFAATISVLTVWLFQSKGAASD